MNPINSSSGQPMVRLLGLVVALTVSTVQAQIVVNNVNANGEAFRVPALPIEWNGKFFMGGGGGFVGSVESQAAGEVNSGYAVGGTDTGHQGSGIEARWALGHEDRLINYGYLAVHRTTETVKALITAYYGRAPERG